MMRIPLLPALLVLPMLAACTGGEGSPAHTNPGLTILAAPGSEFRVALRANQSTGYQWMLVDSAGLGPVRSAGSRYEVPRRDRDRDGAGGTETWTFRALRAGQGLISFVYVGPGEPTAPSDTTRFRVMVR